MHLISKLMIRLTAQKVGQDEFGNQYFETRKSRRGQRKRRYVLYKGQVEASKVPSDWHGWLHYTEQLPPPEKGYAVHDWQQGTSLIPPELNMLPTSWTCAERRTTQQSNW